jgi:hypothetical protein
MEIIITLIAIGYAIGFVIIAYFGIVVRQCDLNKD